MTRVSATVNAILVTIKLAALLLFIAVAFRYFDPTHFDPLMPFGFNKTTQLLPDGQTIERGVMAGAAFSGAGTEGAISDFSTFADPQSVQAT